MNSGFTTDLHVILKNASDCIWIVERPLVYWSKLLNCLITIPYWFESEEPSEDIFETDFASVPRVPLIYSAWGDRAHREAVLHDYLYRIDSKPTVTYSQANEVFLEAMKSTGKPWYIAYGMYWGVVLGGWGSYHKKRVKDKL